MQSVTVLRSDSRDINRIFINRLAATATKTVIIKKNVSDVVEKCLLRTTITLIALA